MLPDFFKGGNVMNRTMVVASGVALATLWAGSALAGTNRFAFSDLTVKDNLTGLTWARDASLGKENWDGAFALVKKLDQKGYAGYKDWRIPSKKEMETLLSYAQTKGYTGGAAVQRHPATLFDSMGFFAVKDSFYLTSTPLAKSDVPCMYVVYMNGFSGFGTLDKDAASYVWPVRGGH